jgi:drug/metabolite transporter (DMT)-like permease
MLPRQEVGAALRVLLAAALFGSSAPASKLLLASFGPFTLAGLLYLGAALAVAPGAVRARSEAPLVPRDAASRRLLAGAIGFGGIVGPVLLLFALRASGAGSVSLLLNLEMAATALLGALWFRETLGPAGWCGVAGVVGAGILLSAGGGWPGFAAAGLVAAACLAWGLDNHWTALQAGLTPVQTTLWKGAAAGSVNLAVGAAAEPWPGASPALWLAALGVGGLAYGASIALSVGAAQQLGATRAQACFASAPFLGAALSFAILGEPLGVRVGVAAALLLVSVGALLAGRHAHEHRHEALEHVHAHRHDDGHHAHLHPDQAPGTLHTHWHRHEPVVHRHVHGPDLHHRHRHGRREEGGAAR